MGVVSDDFNRANNASLGANWTEVGGASASFGIDTNGVVVDSGTDYGYAYWSASSFDNDQYAELTLVAVGFREIGPAVRVQSGSNSGYGFLGGSSGATELVRTNAGTDTVLGSGSVSANDVMRLEVTGTTLTPKLNGTTQAGLVTTDATFSSGSAGIGGTFSGTDTRGDDWTSTDATPSPPLVCYGNPMKRPAGKPAPFKPGNAR